MTDKVMVPELDELEAKCAAPAPWFVDPKKDILGNKLIKGTDDRVSMLGDVYMEADRSTLEFIAALRNAWPQLRTLLAAAPSANAEEVIEMCAKVADGVVGNPIAYAIARQIRSLKSK